MRRSRRVNSEENMQATATAELERIRTVDLEHVGGFRFLAHFGEGYPAVTLDEPPPLGSGAGPDAARLLAAAIGDCLSASLLLCLQKSRVDVHDIRTNVMLTMARNDAGRLRIAARTTASSPRRCAARFRSPSRS
jgi:uncharacterized OsmC-like protein